LDEVHPIEHLRYLARSGYADAPELVAETASALRHLGADPANLLLTCRRIVEKHPTCGPLWWMCAELLTALEPRDTLRRCVERVNEDSTPAQLAGHLATCLPDGGVVVVNGWSWEVAVALAQSFDIEVCVVDGDNGESDGVLIAASFAAPEGIWSPIGSAQLATAAYCADIDVIATTPVGTRLPKVFTDAMVRLVDEDTRGESWHRDIEMVPVALLSAVVGSGGVEDGVSVQATGIRPEAPAATELTVRSAM
jgi:hypothetical protein